MKLEGLGYRGLRKVQSKLSFASRAIWAVSVGEGREPRSLHFREPRRCSPTMDRLAEIKGVGKGRRCVILGTAPSIRDIEISSAKNDYVMVLNRGFQLAERLGRTPNALMITNPYAMAEYGNEALEGNWEHIFLSSAVGHRVEKDVSGLVVFDQWQAPGMEDGFFQFDATKPLYHSGSVAHSAIQVAVWMNFDEIILAGIDLSFPKDDPHFYETKSDELTRAQTTSQANAERMVAGLKVARASIERAGNRVVNAGMQGRYWQKLVTPD